jgi:hypothetical protein
MGPGQRKGGRADTIQCNLWRRAQTHNRMTHSLHVGKDTVLNNGFTAIGKRIGTNKQSEKDSEYIKEHPVIKLEIPLGETCITFAATGFFRSLKMPPPNRRQLDEHQIRRLMRLVLQQSGQQGHGRGRERPEIQVFSRLDIWHKYFLGEHFVNC